MDAVAKERRVLNEFLTSSDNICELNIAFNTICKPLFRAASFNFCNGATACSFREARCGFDLDDTLTFGFVSFFTPGAKLLKDYATLSRLPETDDGIRVLHCLVQCLLKSLDQKVIQKLQQNPDETAYCTMITNHLLSKLGLSSAYVIDSHGQNKYSGCPCGCGMTMEDRYGDTSIGNEEVWHGKLDIVLQNTALNCVVDSDTSEPDVDTTSTDDGKSRSDVAAQPLEQFIAQTVVFSFYQHKEHPEGKNFMIPSIGIRKGKVLIYLYDSENDVFLVSKEIPLLRKTGTDVSVSMEAAVSLWMVINYTHLCTGVTDWEESEINLIPKANFFELLKEKISLYQNDLKLGNVQTDTARKRPADSEVTGPLFVSKKGRYTIFKSTNGTIA